MVSNLVESIYLCTCVVLYFILPLSHNCWYIVCLKILCKCNNYYGMGLETQNDVR